MPGYAARAGNSLDSNVLQRVTVAPEFASPGYDQLLPGATLLLTDAPVQPNATGKAVTVITVGDEY